MYIEQFRTKMSSIVVTKFNCESCDYKCSRSTDWNKHLLTRKHTNRTNRTDLSQKSSACKKCGKEYSARNSLWYHESRCDVSKTVESENVAIINKLLADNQELRNFLVEQSKNTNELMNKALDCCKTTSNNTTINGNVNNNQKFNINLFLNEQCKDAFNFNDFINKIQISYADLENNAQLGFVAGISKIFLDNLKLLDINQRPIHCTDVKRETMYIKDEDKWNKESDDTKLQKAIQTVSYKSMGKLMEWKQENPDYQDMDSEFSKRCLDIQRQTLAGSDRDVYYPKVIHVLAKETMVDK